MKGNLSELPKPKFRKEVLQQDILTALSGNPFADIICIPDPIIGGKDRWLEQGKALSKGFAKGKVKGTPIGNAISKAWRVSLRSQVVVCKGADCTCIEKVKSACSLYDGEYDSEFYMPLFN